jgi:hypothetical protein
LQKIFNETSRRQTRRDNIKADGNKDMNKAQDSMELLIKNYHEEFAALLERAVSGQYHRLCENFLALADLYTVLLRLSALEGRNIDLPSPLMILDREALSSFGYSGPRITRLEQFFQWVQRIYQQEFRVLLASHISVPARRAA